MKGEDQGRQSPLPLPMKQQPHLKIFRKINNMYPEMKVQKAKIIKSSAVVSLMNMREKQISSEQVAVRMRSVKKFKPLRFSGEILLSCLNSSVSAKITTTSTIIVMMYPRLLLSFTNSMKLIRADWSVAVRMRIPMMKREQDNLTRRLKMAPNTLLGISSAANLSKTLSDCMNSIAVDGT